MSDEARHIEEAVAAAGSGGFVASGIGILHGREPRHGEEAIAKRGRKGCDRQVKCVASGRVAGKGHDALL
jgi:hypothetical protein